MEDRQRFLKVYSSLPVALRREVILVLDKIGPMTWEAAYIEVESKTSLGKTICQKLDEMKII